MIPPDEGFLSSGFAKRAASFADARTLKIIGKIVDSAGGTAYPALALAGTSGAYLVDEFALGFARELLIMLLSRDHHDGKQIGQAAYDLANDLIIARVNHFRGLQKAAEK